MKIFLAITFLLSSSHLFAQEDTIPMYRRFPVVPVFKIMTVADSLPFTNKDLKKKKPVIIMLFSPDCEHCKHATKDLVEHIALFKHATIVMVSSLNFSEIKKFAEDNNLSLHKNIVVGRDAGYMLGTFYQIKNYPSVFVYNKKRHFIRRFEGTFKMEDLAAVL